MIWRVLEDLEEDLSDRKDEGCRRRMESYKPPTQISFRVDNSMLYLPRSTNTAHRVSIIVEVR